MTQQNPILKGILLGIIQEGIVTDLLNWRTINNIHEDGLRFDTVPTPGWIPLDGAIGEETVNGKQIRWSTFELAKHIDIPTVLEDVSGKGATVGGRASATQLMLLKKGVAYTINDVFVNGDRGSDPNQPDGLNRIVGNLDSSQTVAPGSQLDISGTSNGQAAIDLLLKGMHQVDGHLPTAAFGNQQFLLRFESVLRQLSLLGVDYNWKRARLEVDDPRRTNTTATTRPAFMFREIPWFDLGYKADQTTQVILNTYGDGGLGSNNNTRLFFIKEGPDEFEAIQSRPPTVTSIGVLQDKDNYRWRFTWVPGFACWNPRAVVKVIGLKVT
jgi:hypothetical protein